MKKVKKLFSVLLVICLLVTILPVHADAAATKLSAQEVADYFLSLVGNDAAAGYCLRFVADGFNALGAKRSSACCAYKYGTSHIDSKDMDNIPVGADVFFEKCGGGPCESCGADYYGHIGVYVGNGYFVHSTGGEVLKTKITSTYYKNHFRGWGYHGNVKITDSVSSSCDCSDEYAGDYVCITTDANLNIRSGHGSSYGLVGKIPPGATVYISKASGTGSDDWGHVEYDGMKGYSSMEYLRKAYKVSYDANGGSGAPSSQTKVHGKKLTLRTKVPTRDGYTFLGWATTSSATAPEYQPGGSYKTNAEVTLYAVWKSNSSILLGDVNRDGEVSNQDLIIAARYVVGLISSDSVILKYGDMNSDGSVTNTDLIMIARIIVGLL